MSENTGYLLSRVGLEYNDEGYTVSDGVEPDTVYWYYGEAESAAKEAVAELVKEDDQIGHYCYSINYRKFEKMQKKFPELFDDYGDFNSLLAEESGKIDEIVEYITENFELFTVQEIDIVGLK